MCFRINNTYHWNSISSDCTRILLTCFAVIYELRLTKCELTFIGCSGSNRSTFYFYIRQIVRASSAPLVMHRCDCSRGVAYVR